MDTRNRINEQLLEAITADNLGSVIDVIFSRNEGGDQNIHTALELVCMDVDTPDLTVRQNYRKAAAYLLAKGANPNVMSQCYDSH